MKEKDICISIWRFQLTQIESANINYGHLMSFSLEWYNQLDVTKMVDIEGRWEDQGIRFNLKYINMEDGNQK